MSYLDNIKALASELANMAPKTQMELIKLCKDLCINTKNYLVAFDETTLPAIDARIDALETLTTNLSSELDTAEGNIIENSNAIVLINSAIDTINDTITTIQTALSNVYTKSQIDTILASYYTKSQVDTALNGKASLSSNNTFTGTNRFNNSVYFNDADDFYFTAQSDTLQALLNEKQDELVSGSNIKTINNTSLLGSGNINISGGSQLYKHRILLTLSYTGDTNNFSYYLAFDIISSDSQPYTINTEIDVIKDFFPHSCYEGDSDGMQNQFIPAMINEINYINGVNKTIELYYYDKNNNLNYTSKYFNIDELSDVVRTL